jgi:hypothetical protein
MRVSIFAPPNMKDDIDCTVNLENTHMDGHGMLHYDSITSASHDMLLRWFDHGLPENKDSFELALNGLVHLHHHLRWGRPTLFAQQSGRC